MIFLNGVLIEIQGVKGQETRFNKTSKVLIPLYFCLTSMNFLKNHSKLPDRVKKLTEEKE